MGDGMFVVDDIVDHREVPRGSGKFEYLCTWVGYDPVTEKTWEPMESLPADLISDYREQIVADYQAGQ